MRLAGLFNFWMDVFAVVYKNTYGGLNKSKIGIADFVDTEFTEKIRNKLFEIFLFVVIILDVAGLAVSNS